MEVALVARDEGAQVHYLNLRNGLPRVEDHTWIPTCVDVNSFRIAQAKKLLEDAGIHVMGSRSARDERRAALLRADLMLRECSDLAELRALQYRDFLDIGWGVLSSVIEATRNPFVGLQTHYELFRELLASSILVYDNVREHILRLSPDAVLLFNGRFATTRAIQRAAEHAGVRRLIHERGCDKNHYWLAVDSTYDPDYVQAAIRDYWRSDLDEAGRAFFIDRRSRIEKGWYSFTKSQAAGRLPESMTGRDNWVVFFTTSDDEYVAAGDKYENADFPAQRDAIFAVVEAIRRTPGWRLCIRLHPNIATKSRAQRAYWKNLNISGVVVIPPEDNADSYAILDRASVVCSYGSTMGVEATYWGKPSLLLGRATYDKLNVCRRARNVEDIESFLQNPKVFPQAGALAYGAFFSGFGIPYKYYHPFNFRNGSILGTELDAVPVKWARHVRDGALRMLTSH